MQRWTIGRALVAGVAVAAMAVMAPTASASPAVPSQQAPPAGILIKPGELTYLRERSTPATGFVAPRPSSGPRASTVSANIVVTYSGFPAAAKTAFQRAVDLWSTLIESDVPIRIQATYKALPTGVLGGAGPADAIANFPGAPQTNTWFPVALANARYGSDLSAEPDVIAEFQSNTSKWYFGTDGNVPANKLDFTTVVLHEIGHGLGIVDSFDVAGNRGSWGLGSPYPFRYDRLVQNSAGTSLASVTNNSTALATYLQSGTLRWGGSQGVAANGGTKPHIYSPSPYEPGSSIGHLDEDVYATGTPNALMTPYLEDGEALHDPGDVALAMMRDLGWTTVGAKGVAAAPAAPAAVAGNGRAHLSWTPPKDTGRQFLNGYRLYRFPNGSNTADQTIDVAANVTSTSFTGLANGTTYRFAVAAKNPSGVGAASAKSAAVVPTDLGPFLRADTFVRQQFQDFHNRQPTSAELLSWLSTLNSGAKTPAATATGIAQLKGSYDVSTRVTRLYFAYFKRLPDFGGYTYWSGRLRSGASLKKASDTFAASSEFRNTYGSLSNGAFVDLVYRNVLDRDPDSGGRTYWVNKLNRRTASRGQVMLNFSESSENVTKMASEVEAVLARAALLRRMPSADEFTTDVAALDGADDLDDLIAVLLASPAYDARIP